MTRDLLTELISWSADRLTSAFVLVFCWLVGAFRGRFADPSLIDATRILSSL